MKRIFISLVLLSLPAMVFAQGVSKVGTTSAPFLNIGVGARALGMGGAYVAVANDATAMFWNAGAMATLPHNEAVVHHAEWLAEMNYDYVGSVFHVGALGTFGASVTVFSAGDIERTTELAPEGTGEIFNPTSLALGLAYGRRLTDRFSFGVNVKYVSESIYNSASRGFAVDFGTLYDTGFHGLMLGAAILNFGQALRLDGRDLITQVPADPTRSGSNQNIPADLTTDNFDLPLMLRVGVSIDVLRKSEKNSFLLAVEAIHPNDNVESMSVGAEYSYAGIAFVRGGYRQMFSRDNEQGLTAGGGLNYSFGSSLALKLDYVWQDYGRLNSVQMFTFGIGF